MKRGFTLIELLIVIAIIGVLSSIVMANLNQARTKSKDALLRQEAMQFRVLLEQEYSDTGSYFGLNPRTWINNSASCGTVFSGNYAAQAKTICEAIFANSSPTSWSTTFKFFLGACGVSPCTNPVNQYSYSIMIALPYKNTFLCLGSSGVTSDTTNSWPTDTPWWNQPGCYNNP